MNRRYLLYGSENENVLGIGESNVELGTFRHLMFWAYHRTHIANKLIKFLHENEESKLNFGTAFFVFAYLHFSDLSQSRHFPCDAAQQ